MTEYQEKVLTILKDNCGGICLTDPSNCECFGVPPQSLIDELGEDYDEDNNFYSVDDCMHYENMASILDNDKKIFDEMIITICDGLFTDEELEELTSDCWEMDCKNIDFIGKLSFWVAIKKMPKTTKKGKRKEYVYILHSDHGVKIGRSHQPEIRSRTIGTKAPFEITKTEIFEVKDMKVAENGLHKHFKQNRINGEWFNLSESQIQEAKDIIDKQYSDIKDTLKPLFDVKRLEE